MDIDINGEIIIDLKVLHQNHHLLLRYRQIIFHQSILVEFGILIIHGQLKKICGEIHQVQISRDVGHVQNDGMYLVLGSGMKFIIYGIAHHKRVQPMKRYDIILLKTLI